MSDRSLFLVVIGLAVLVGFVLGYGVRALKTATQASSQRATRLRCQFLADGSGRIPDLID
jgi:hypothetical protein